MLTRKVVSVLTLALSVLFVRSQELNLISYNIKYDNTNDTLNNWNDRKATMVSLLKKQQPDFIGMQEVLFNQLTYLDKALVCYSYIGIGRDDGQKKGEFSPIFYDTEKYTLLTSSTFWLSETPDKISIGWDAALERICTYGLFQDKITQGKVWVFNTHFDHKGEMARVNSVQLILKKLKQLNDAKLPLVLMGDFNLMPKEEPILSLQEEMDDGLLISKTLLQGPKGTYNGFDVNSPIEKRIDYIFTGGFEVESYHHIDERLDNGKHISDHLPVFIKVK